MSVLALILNNQDDEILIYRFKKPFEKWIFLAFPSHKIFYLWP